MKQSRISAFIALVPFALTSCASIVRHPEVDHVKKLAIVSVYTNQDIPKVGGGGSNSGGLAFLKKAVEGKDADTGDTSNRVRLAKYALDKYTALLSQVPGWQVIPAERVLASNDYQALGKIDAKKTGGNRTLASIGEFAQKIDQAKFNTPPKMWAIRLDGTNNNRAELEQGLAQLCRKLGVDAVAVVNLDLAYEAGFFSVAGTGASHASVASSVKILNKDGKYAVVFPDLQPAAGKRYDSNTGITMIGGRISMSGDTEKAFQEAIDKTALNDLEVIRTGLAKR